MLLDLRIGTRASQLALWQANHLRKKLLENHPDLKVVLVEITTTGDRIRHKPIRSIGGKALFLKEIEAALLDGSIDLAVHSLKDMPSQLPDGLSLGAILARDNPLDALLLNPNQNTLKQGAQVATGSLRRRYQLSHWRNDLQFQDIRGNIDTRLGQLADNRFDALVLSAAGLERMGWDDQINQLLPVEVMIPAAGQGAIAVEIRSDDRQMQAMIAPLNHPESDLCVSTERAFTATIGADCSVPVGAFAELAADQLILTACIAGLDGNTMLKTKVQDASDNYYKISQQAAENIIAQGGDTIIQSYRNSD